MVIHHPSLEKFSVATSISRKEVVVIPDHCYDTSNWIGEDWVPVTHYFPQRVGRDDQIELRTALDVLVFFYSGYKVLGVADVGKKYYSLIEALKELTPSWHGK